MYKLRMSAKITPKTDKSVFVYLMIDKANGYHKIGYTKNPKKRESTLQSEKPSIEIVCQFKGFISDETYLHNKFAVKRIRGEWFDLTTKDIELIHKHFNQKGVFNVG